MFWMEVDTFLKKKLKINIEINMFDVMLIVCQDKIEKNMMYIIQLFIIFGKFHIHKKKWSGTKPTFLHFINTFQQYSTL